MVDIFKQILIGVTIAAIAGVWAFASTRASTASVDNVRLEIKEFEAEIDQDIEIIGINIDEIKDIWHDAAIEQAEFRAQVREKLDIRDR